MNLLRDLAAYPSVEEANLDCVTGMTKAEIHAASRQLNLGVRQRMDQWLATQKELDEMAQEQRTRSAIHAWDEHLEKRREQFDESYQVPYFDRQRIEAWSRLVSLGESVVPREAAV